MAGANSYELHCIFIFRNGFDNSKITVLIQRKFVTQRQTVSTISLFVQQRLKYKSHYIKYFYSQELGFLKVNRNDHTILFRSPHLLIIAFLPVIICKEIFIDQGIIGINF